MSHKHQHQQQPSPPPPQHCKVVFLCKKRIAYGSAYGLMNSAAFISDFLNDKNISSDVVTVQDANAIDREVTLRNPAIVIIEAIWVTPEKFQELLRIPRHQNRLWIVRIHSRAAFIANEGIAMDWLNRYRKVKGLVIAPNTEEFTKDLKETFGLTTKFLPNIYYPKDGLPEKPVVVTKLPGEVHVGCFGAVRPMKNQLTQAIGAVKYADEMGLSLRFHINAERQEQNGDQVLKNLRAYFEGEKELQKDHQLIEHRWLTHAEFIDLVKQMDVSMQVSFTETFNIVAADSVSQGVPTVGSTQIEWLPDSFQVDNPNSSMEIAKKLAFALSWTGRNMSWVCKHYLEEHNHHAEKIWLKYCREE